MFQVFGLLLFVSFGASANPYVIKQNSSETYLKVEVLEDRGLHFEVMKKAPANDRIWTSPMVLENPALSKSSSMTSGVIRTRDFVVKINQDNLCVSVRDLKQSWDFITTCPSNVDQAWKGLALFTNDALNAYGLGAYYHHPGTADGDWVGRVWDPQSHTFGNALRGFSKGANSYAMFPVLYVQGTGLKNYMLFYDSVYKQMWSLNGHPWKVDSYGDQIRWYIFTEDNVKKLRQKFMNLTGKPPVPPKAAFGMWLSEFGYENWNEIHEDLNSMYQNHLPVDGVALDIQWFGGKFYEGGADRSRSRFGTLQFDEGNFPNPRASLAYLKNKRGVEVMAIEESYVSQWLPEFRVLDQKGFFARNCWNMATTILTANPWWGIGGMIDWTNPDAGIFWHNEKRQKLYELGINYHWTDLGEPEMYDPGSCYYGFQELRKHQHGDIHNILNFKWIESIANGYKFNENKRRPFMMSRSGTAGIQRFGAAIWSGDIGANMGAMTAHYQTQMHMSYSGVDYFGADIGGFHRRDDTLDGNPQELYTQWFANAVLFDFPVRAHTWNLANNLETAPSKIGDLESNRFNLKLRYKLLPYYYSLAHEANQQGLPVIVPMSMEFPDDLKVRKMGNQKMIGSHLMAAMVASYGEKQRNIYLPKGEWIDWHNGKHYASFGETVGPVKTEDSGIFRIPLFIRKGAIIPMMKDMEERSNISGLLLDGTTNNDLVVKVYPSATRSCFTLHEDDGVTIAYKSGKVTKTLICQEMIGRTIQVSMNLTQNHYMDIRSRNLEIEVLTVSPPILVQVNGKYISDFRMENGVLKIQLGERSSSSQKIVIQF